MGTCQAEMGVKVVWWKSRLRNIPPKIRQDEHWKDAARVQIVFALAGICPA